MGEQARTAKRRRWLGRLHDAQPRGGVQVEDGVRGVSSFSLPEHVLRLAQAEYDRLHPGQPYERMQERGGLGVLEVVALLADYAERLGALPSEPAKKNPGTGRWMQPPDPMTSASTSEGDDRG